MKTRLAKRLSCMAILTLTVSACGGSGSSISLRNPDFFSARVSDNSMSGMFNSQGSNASQVRNLVSATCEGSKLSGFQTGDGKDGLTAFSATCSKWKDGARAVEYERISGSNVMIEITGVNSSGSLTYSRLDKKI